MAAAMPHFTGCMTMRCCIGAATRIPVGPVPRLRTNVPLYPEFQAFFRERQPPTLIVWGGMTRFPADGADGAGPYPHDLPSADLHLLDTGHFALEDRLELMAPLIHDFLDRNIASR